MPDDVVAYLEIALGVAIAIVLPPLRAFVVQKFKPDAAGGVDLSKYAALLAFSLVTGLVVYVVYRQAQPAGEISFVAALAAGFTWEAFLEKVATGSG